MPKFNPKALRADAPHKVKVRLVIRDEAGEKQEVTTDVFYRALSLDDQVGFPSVEGKEGTGRVEAVKEQLALLVVKIPDFGVGPVADGFEQEADACFFGAMEDSFFNAISEAIAEDRDPNATPSGSSSITTGAEGK
jgi:hypothetical protein